MKKSDFMSGVCQHIFKVVEDCRDYGLTRGETAQILMLVLETQCLTRENVEHAVKRFLGCGGQSLKDSEVYRDEPSRFDEQAKLALVEIDVRFDALAADIAIEIEIDPARMGKGGEA